MSYVPVKDNIKSNVERVYLIDDREVREQLGDIIAKIAASHHCLLRKLKQNSLIILSAQPLLSYLTLVGPLIL